MFSSTYIDIYSKCRCGKVEAFQDLVRMGDEGDNLARGYHALTLFRSSILVVPMDKVQAASIFKEILPWLLEKEHEDVYNSAHVWYLLGVCLLEDVGVGNIQDKPRAIRYHELAFAKGHAVAQCDLALCYDVGLGVKRNMPKALSYYLMSAEQGFPVAQCNVSLCYENGDGCPVDMEKAIFYAILSADQGYANALYSLCVFFMYGKGVEPDRYQAIDYCQQGADQGDLDSMYVLGDSYLRGYARMQDEEKGFRLLLSAADRQHNLSQLYVAECYRKGEGVTADIIEAVRYVRRAAKQGDGQRAMKKLQEYEEEFRAQVWLNRKDFLMFLATYQFLFATALTPEDPVADNSIHTCFYSKDLCWCISQFL